jgi:SNF2 family DNA or RNA helicase
MLYKPHNYQKKGIQHILTHPGAGCLWSVGTGKTSMTLTALEYLINSLEIDKVLIVAPPRVASATWKDELEKWDHLKSLKISRLIGTPAQRIKALSVKADLYTISSGNLAWLVHYAIKTWKRWPFSLVVDESSMYRNPSSMRFKALKKVAPLSPRVIILTGTVAPNGLLGLWSQIYLLDQGQRLGRTYTEFKDRYFKPGARNGHIIFQWELKKGAEKLIYDAISDICLSMEASDYLEMPKRIDIYEDIELANYEQYEDFKKTEVLQLANDFELTPVSAVSMYSKLLQFSQGAIYLGDGTYEVIDDSKLSALCEDIESLNGDPVLVGYLFKSDYERIMQRIPHAVKLDSDEKIAAWNRKEISVALAQYSSISHGVNAQHGGNQLRLFGMPWDLETLIQFIGRVDRQGQEKPVICKYYMGKGTIEHLIKERLEGKIKTQSDLIEALKRELF